MQAVDSDKRRRHAPAKRLTLGVAAACAALALSAGAASAQTGGATAPTASPSPSGTTSSGHPQVFPVPGAHYYGDGFGAGRGHRGQDVFAACGEPLVAVSWARVVFRGKQRRAGKYVVLRYKRLKQDYVYMHLKGWPVVKKRQKVRPGQLIGYVGKSGNASACHLHFELWTGKWYRGGRASRSVTQWLQHWDSYS